MRLFFIEEQDDSSFDLLAWAEHARGAYDLWCAYYPSNNADVVQVREVPVQCPDAPAAISWADVKDACTFVRLRDEDEWETFAEANKDALTDQYGSTVKALQQATQGGLTLGGGAAPLFHVHFVED